MNNKMKMNAKTGHLQKCRKKRREKRGMAALFAAFFGVIPAFAAADMEDIRSLNLSTLPVLAHSGLGGVIRRGPPPAQPAVREDRPRGAIVGATVFPCGGGDGREHAQTFQGKRPPR
ncbi:MAG: hypothetical protein MPK10_05980, partial [Gammaproteobacteria bacterium]|nr:hypothetical protein [Gammaproteobacteria bacterium]